ncbi:MAG TPA: hypothetical protein VGF59_16465 [Bryobacteraceae bacterium]|jgi:hypothetical protein
MLYTIRDIDNGLEVKNSTGLTFSAHFDGKEYPAAGAADGTTASLTRIDDRTIRMALNAKMEPSAEPLL